MPGVISTQDTMHALFEPTRLCSDVPLGKFLSRKRSTGKSRIRRNTKIPSADPSRHTRAYNRACPGSIRRVVLTFPQAPSPTMTNFLRISDI